MLVISPGADEELPPLPLSEGSWRTVSRQLRLSRRQEAVARLLLQNQSDEAILTRLRIKESTLRTHLKRVFAKAGVATRLEFALRVCALSHEPGRSPGT